MVGRQSILISERVAKYTNNVETETMMPDGIWIVVLYCVIVGLGCGAYLITLEWTPESVSDKCFERK